MIITASTASGITIVEVKGPLLGGEEIQEFRRALDSVVEAGAEKLIVDVNGVTHINSAAIGILVAAHASYTRRHWKMVVCGLNKVVYTVLTITKLNRVLDLFETRAEAIAHLQ
jgi:anti-anti-sigma factor